MTDKTLVVHADPDLLAQAVAARLVVKMIDAQAERGQASIVLTGGRIAAAVYRAVRDLPARDAVDWSRVDIWWGDERFLPAGHPDRNETQARAALLDHLPLTPARVHPMPPSDGPDGADPEAAAARYAEALVAAGGPAALPHFDVLMLGVGEDGHVASIFPEHPVGYENRAVAAVRGSPKPPPVRVTLTRSTINSAEEVWLLVSGEAKADAVADALSAPPSRDRAATNPAAGLQGRRATRWLLDRAAAGKLPAPPG